MFIDKLTVRVGLKFLLMALICNYEIKFPKVGFD